MNKDIFIFWYIWNSHCNMSLLTFILAALFSHLVFRSLYCWLTDKVWIFQLNIQPKMLGERAQVIIRYHEKYITRIWSHVSVERRKLTRNIKGYDVMMQNCYRWFAWSQKYIINWVLIRPLNLPTRWFGRYWWWLWHEGV